MKKILLLFISLMPWVAFSQSVAATDYVIVDDVLEGESCTSIMVGKKASTDGSVITSHTCDGRYRTWMTIEPAADYEAGAEMEIRKGTMHTGYRADTTGVRIVGRIPQARHTYSYLNTAYPCFNEKQLAIGETTFGGPDTLRNGNGMFNIEELERVALMRCSSAKEAINLIASLIREYGYGDAGECITIADVNEVWQMEIIGAGKHTIGGMWVAQRVPDDHVAVSANIPRIGRLRRHDKHNFLCSDNIEEVAKAHGLWDGQGDFVWWKAVAPGYANGKNFREREYFIFNSLAPSMHLSMDMDEFPFSIKPDDPVDVKDVTRLLRSTYEGTDLDMCKNIKCVVNRRAPDGSIYKDTVISPIANPWLTGTMQATLNHIAPGTVDFKRTVSVAWCSYSFVAQLRSWLPDQVGGICWVALDNPGQSPRVPIFCGTTRLPEAYNLCGQKGFNEQTALWKYRKANKLATLAWQRNKLGMKKEVLRLEKEAMEGLPKLQQNITTMLQLADETNDPTTRIHNMLDDYTFRIFDNTTYAWNKLEVSYWQMFGLGF